MQSKKERTETMNIPNINFLGIFKGLASIPNIIAMFQNLSKYLAVLHMIRNGLKIPAANFLIAIKKETANLKALAATTDLNGDGINTNDIDDKVIGGVDSFVDNIIEVFHLRQEYEKLISLDKAVEPK